LDFKTNFHYSIFTKTPIPLLKKELFLLFSKAKKEAKSAFYNSTKELADTPLRCGHHRRQSSRSNSIPYC
jgi:hypothetical protein